MSRLHGQSTKHKLNELGERLDLVTDGDRRFFERHKHRNYHLRRAGQVELEEGAILGASPTLPPGAAWFVIVRQLGPGVRTRIPVILPEETDTDRSEAEVEAFLQHVLRANQ